MHVPKKVLPAQRAWKPGLPIDKHKRFGSNHDSQTHFVPRGHCPGATGPIEKVAIVQTGHASAGQSRDHGQGTATCQPPSGGRFPESPNHNGFAPGLPERPKWPAVPTHKAFGQSNPSKRHNSSWSHWAPSAKPKRARSPSCTYSILEPSGPLAIGSKMLHCPRTMMASWFHFHGSRQPPQLRKPICNGATSNRMALTFPFLCPSMALRRTSSCPMRMPATWPKPRKRPERPDSIFHVQRHETPSCKASAKRAKVQCRFAI